MFFESLSDPNPDLVLDTKEMIKPVRMGKKIYSGVATLVGGMKDGGIGTWYICRHSRRQ
jgi:hypothetical protein